MQPVARSDAAFADVLATQNLLADKRHHHGVLGVVIGGIAVSDVLHRHTAHEREDARVIRLKHAVDMQVARLQFAHERFDDDLGRIEHGASCSPRRALA